jgi:hypothetical protein
MKRTIEVPELVFTEWYLWEKRTSIKNSNYPGIYMIAISKNNLSGHRPSYKDVCYIGMTNSHKGLQGRWYQFYRSIQGKSGHSGGNTVFRALGHYNTWSERLFVCALTVICDPVSPTEEDLRDMGIVAFLEYDAFAAFMNVVPDQQKPKFNTK